MPQTPKSNNNINKHFGFCVKERFLNSSTYIILFLLCVACSIYWWGMWRQARSYSIKQSCCLYLKHYFSFSLFGILLLRLLLLRSSSSKGSKVVISSSSVLEDSESLTSGQKFKLEWSPSVWFHCLNSTCTCCLDFQVLVLDMQNQAFHLGFETFGIWKILSYGFWSMCLSFKRVQFAAHNFNSSS